MIRRRGQTKLDRDRLEIAQMHLVNAYRVIDELEAEGDQDAATIRRHIFRGIIVCRASLKRKGADNA